MSGLCGARKGWGLGVCLGFARGLAGGWRVVVGWSEEEVGEVEGGFGAVVFDAALPVGAEEVEAEGVGGGVDFGEEFSAEGGPLGGVDFTFENGELDALAVVGTVFGDAAESVSAGFGIGGDIVGDENEHGYLQMKGG